LLNFVQRYITLKAQVTSTAKSVDRIIDLFTPQAARQQVLNNWLCSALIIGKGHCLYGLGSQYLDPTQSISGR
jgi:Tfp pilus assembly pilus retraction ATPase PilT